ncbi:MAG: hypothetical protein JXR34_05110 [Bacteroidales bacterium]|nr:hypothetical protein [Bacteroidales bacterium]
MKEIEIKYNSQRFWIKEYFIELLSQYICETFEEIGLSSFNTILTGIYDDCDMNRSGEACQSVNILLDDIVNTSDKITMISVLQQSKIRVLSLGNELSVFTLNEFENNKTDDSFKHPWEIAVKTQSLAATIDFIIDLLNGTFQYHNRMIHYINFPNPNNAYIMV